MILKRQNQLKKRQHGEWKQELEREMVFALGIIDQITGKYVEASDRETHIDTYKRRLKEHGDIISGWRTELL